MNELNILVTGACGTIGSALIQSLLSNQNSTTNTLIGIDNNESELFFLDQRYLSDPRASFFLADIRDKDSLTSIMRGIDIVFHAAALKHVVMCERSPKEAIQTNINGVENIIFAAIENRVKKVIFTSSDKAVNPTNVMGTSKLMGERLITAANGMNKDIIFSSTRFGNVLGSNGSVIPIFKKQIEAGGPITLTDENMTRFIMTIDEAVKLVINSANQAIGGEVFVTKMPVIAIADLAQAMIELLASHYGHNANSIDIDMIGAKPGEKLYEELMNHEETRRAIELKDYFSVLPAFKGFSEQNYCYEGILTETIEDPYISASQPKMSISEIKDYLSKNNLIEIKANDFGKRYWPGEKEEVQ